MSTPEPFLYVWHWRTMQDPRRPPGVRCPHPFAHRAGERFRVVARGSMNSALIEFTDGFRSVVSRNSLQKAPERASSAPLAPLAQQLDLDGRLHDLARQTRQERLFTPAPTQLAGQTSMADEAAPPTNEGDA